MWLIYLAASVVGQFAMWSLTSRLMYRHYYYQDTDHQGAASLGGFFWPVTLLIYLVTSALKPAVWAQTAPSLKERKEKRREARRERLRNLDGQIADAEGYLKTVTEHLREIQE